MSFLLLWLVAFAVILARFFIKSSEPELSAFPAQARLSGSIVGASKAGRFSASTQFWEPLGYQTNEFERIKREIAEVELDIKNHLGF